MLQLFISFILGAALTAIIVSYERDDAYGEGYREGWLDAKEQYQRERQESDT